MIFNGCWLISCIGWVWCAREICDVRAWVFWIMTLQKNCVCRLEYLDLRSVYVLDRVVFLSSHSNCVCLWGIVSGSRGLWVALLIQICQYEELLTPQRLKQILKRGNPAFILPVVSSMIQDIFIGNVNSFFVVIYSDVFSVVKIILFLLIEHHFLKMLSLKNNILSLSGCSLALIE